MSTTTLTEKALESPSIDIKQLSEKEKQELIAADAASITSGTTLGAASHLPFQPAKSLHINTKGIPVLRLPLPPSELTITIHNPDGTVAYQSTRERRSSGNCVLTDPDGRELIGTTYFFGPKKDPVLTRLDVGGDGDSNTIKTVSKWTSRSQKFLLPDGRTFDWEYKKEKGFGGEGKKGTALVLTMDGKRIAALIRNEETRTPGSKGCSAGNGGELVLGDEVGGKEGVSEEVVVATCLLMLKKEIDRRRAVQFMMLAAAASGGS
ncbi:hypothetical protein BU26DRAFT_563272 [Trematosphaeria pertusa]|uniref:Uncharacterized protein n=1 Tax=Trematosphaeria pertusa TaxID=390896 RepID=A0A6A6ILM8_9PLEO|nr:uncharacterized protein BU26DRAFT_563272 [Trematosphaeria pertusa]KAF2251331.1 hypothetical protein BU26DRAFT_563272 [Trematosphaeria pertusa]